MAVNWTVGKINFHTGQDTARVQVKGEDLGGNAPTQTLGEHV